MSEGRVYLKNSLEGMTGDELILFVYAENVKILQMARHYFDSGEVEKRVLAINKAIEVTTTLSSILNYQAGEIAFRLKSLYTFSIRQLSRANYDKKPELVDDVLKIFRELLAAWKEKMAKDRLSPAAQLDPSHSPEKAAKLEIYG